MRKWVEAARLMQAPFVFFSNSLHIKHNIDDFEFVTDELVIQNFKLLLNPKDML